MAVAMTMAVSFVVVFIVAVTVTMSVPFLIARHIHILVPVVTHEINRPAAGAVLAAMLGPVLGVAGRNAQVEWRPMLDGDVLDDHRVAVDHAWLRKITDVDLPIESRLADVDGYADVGGEGGCTDNC